MPRIDDQILDTVIYMYPSVLSAEQGERAGGTGFLVAVKSEQHENWIYIYAVTNSHVIREAASPIVRFNTRKGDLAIAPLTYDNWTHHPDGDDVAIASIGGIDPNIIKYRCIPTEMFLDSKVIDDHKIGPGDDVFMVGRFSRHDGRQQNLPSARFGNISMMPKERIRHARGYDVESFLIETRSLSGYSGSPVFVHIPPASHRPGDDAAITLGRETGPWFLGVDWGHLPIYEKVKEKDEVTDAQEGYVVQSNSGQMAVVPAWKLLELLNQEKFDMARKQADKERAKDKAESPVVLDAQIQSSSETFNRNAFEDALKRASRKVSEPESKDSGK